MAHRQTAVFTTVERLLADFVASRGHRRCTFHCLLRLSARAGLRRESLARRTRARMTENVAAVRAGLVSLFATDLTAAVRRYVLMKLRIFHFTCNRA